jgi:hypothetical protein
MSVLPGDQIIKGVPEALVPGFQFFNHPIVANPKDSVWNPLEMIKRKCVPEDFVIFKLDIDDKPTEGEIVKQLGEDPVARALIDEFYYEDHFHNKAMRLHGWESYETSLADYYKIIIPQRHKGFRMHYWP